LLVSTAAAQTSELKSSRRAATASRSVDSAIDRSASAIRIGPGDLLELKIFGAPELGSTLRVSNEGEITIALIGSIKIAGLTPELAQTEIERRFRDGGYLRDPHVNILIKEFASQGISVLGEVTHPGVYPLLGSPRLLDAIAAAGGTTARAGKTVLVTRRNDLDAPQKVLLSLNAEQVSTHDIELRPGDTVVVSRTGIVYVSGDVHTPGGFVMDQNENLTVLQALALAQGLNPTASLGRVRIIRRHAGTLKEIPVALKEIMEAKSPDIELQDADVLFVPSSTSKSAARRSLESIVQVATGLAIYRR
ncbi:MAG TPA: polysaccharide biosynthesis/export family protein, partial [Terriglobales bacterium]|nr:polysaccharide biosynthesis/export family protein [Terriglobales bacterium]